MASMSDRRTMTGGWTGKWSKRVGIATGILAIIGTLGGWTLHMLDTRYAQGEMADSVDRKDLEKIVTDAVDNGIKPLREEQERMRERIEEIRCLLLEGRFILGRCVPKPDP